MNITINDIFVRFSEKEMNRMLGKLARWCDNGGDLLDHKVEPSDLFEQYKYLLEVHAIAKKCEQCNGEGTWSHLEP